MNRIRRFSSAIPLAMAAVFGAVLWASREQALVFGPLRFDALSLFWLVALLVGAAQTLASRSSARMAPQAAALFVLACIAVSVRSLALIVVCYGLIALLSVVRWPRQAADVGPLRLAAGLLQRAPLPLAAICLALGYGGLLLAGVATYDDPGAGAAMSSVMFWFVLLAATAMLAVGGWQHKTVRAAYCSVWLYPLVRLYSIGPWNAGWALATALFGGTMALWLGWRALRAPVPTAAIMLALALAAFGLASSAGIAAGCLLLLVAAISDEAGSAVRWPTLVAPLVGVWALIGAAVAGGIVALAGAAWLVALLLALATIQAKTQQRAGGFPIGGSSLALAIGSPLVLQWLIAPVVGQLQGGLTPYGAVLIWPWIGMAFVNSAQTQVAVLPSLAVALLLGVLVALIYLLARLRRTLPEPSTGEQPDQGDFSWLWAIIREEVPWLQKGRRRDPR